MTDKINHRDGNTFPTLKIRSPFDKLPIPTPNTFLYNSHQTPFLPPLPLPPQTRGPWYRPPTSAKLFPRPAPRLSIKALNINYIITHFHTVAPRGRRRPGPGCERLYRRTKQTRRQRRDGNSPRRRCSIEHWARNRASLSILGTVDGAAHGPRSRDRGPACPRRPSLQHLQMKNVKVNIFLFAFKFVT